MYDVTYPLYLYSRKYGVSVLRTGTDNETRMHPVIGNGNISNKERVVTCT